MNVIFFVQAEDGIRDRTVTGVQTCALPISLRFTDVPAVFDILAPASCTYPCAQMRRGRARSAASSIAGQMTQWKRVIPLPMTCRSAGHSRAYPFSGNPVAER